MAYSFRRRKPQVGGGFGATCFFDVPVVAPHHKIGTTLVSPTNFEASAAVLHFSNDVY